MELLDSWVRSLKAGNRSPATIDAYVRDIGHLLHHLGDTDVTAATRRHVEAFLAERTRVDGRPGTLADATIARRYRTPVAVLRVARRRGLSWPAPAYDEDACRRRSLSSLRRSSPRTRWRSCSRRAAVCRLARRPVTVPGRMRRAEGVSRSTSAAGTRRSCCSSRPLVCAPGRSWA
ncbi:MAG: site-specific integrase [Acidimicrobiaceae bacterium]|nr:site-specific integrase [Acidimicrobiaceae bacterium]